MISSSNDYANALFMIAAEDGKLEDYNRDLLRAMINEYQKGEFLSIDLLLDGDQLSDNSIGLNIAPKINAVGRVDKSTNTNRLIKYFTSEDKEEIISYKNWIVAYNDLRKEKSKNAKENIVNTLSDSDDPAIVIVADLEEGLLGLVANSLMNQFNVPSIVFTSDSTNPDLLKGSARSIEGFNLSDALQTLSEYEETFGGHALAAGLSIKKDNLETFKEKFFELVKNSKIIKPEKKTIDISINDINEESYNLIQSFGPFGEEWKAPLFKIKRIKADTLMYSKNQDHIITSISMKSRIIGFNYSRSYMRDFVYIDIIGSFRVSEYKGNRYVEFIISDLMESK